MQMHNRKTHEQEAHETTDTQAALERAFDAVNYHAGVIRASVRDNMQDTLPNGKKNKAKEKILEAVDLNFDLCDTLRQAIEARSKS